MAIAFVAATEYDSDGNEEAHTIILPSNSTGDLVIVHLQGSGTTALNWETIPSGWTELIDETNLTTTIGMGAAQIWYKIVGASESNPTWDFGAFNGLTLRAHAATYSGTATVSPFDIYTTTWNTGSSSSPLSPDETTTSTNTMILRLMTYDDEDGTEGSIFPSGVTNRAFGQFPSPSNGGGFCFGEQGLQASTGATGSKTWSLDASEGWGAVTIAIRDAANDVQINDKDVTFDSRLVKVFTEDVTFDSVLAKVFPKDTTFDSVLQATFTKDITFDVALVKVFQKDLTFDAGLNILVSNTLTVNSDILNLVDNNVSILYDINNFVSNTISYVYDIENLVSNTITGRYDILNFVSNTLSGVYDILGSVSNTLTGLYDINNFVSNVMTVKYDILNFVSNTLDIRYDILNHVSNSITFLYDILEKHTNIPIPNKIRIVKTLKDNNTVDTGTGTSKTLNT